MKEELALTQCFGIGGQARKEAMVEGETVFREEGDTLTRMIRERYQAIADGSLHCLVFLHIRTEHMGGGGTIGVVIIYYGYTVLFRLD